MNAAALAELMGKQAKQDRAKKGRAAGGDATPKQKAERLHTTSTLKRSDRGNMSTPKAAKSARVSERKVRQAAAVRKLDLERVRELQRIRPRSPRQKHPARPL